ncbi:MAG: hypothetical protein L3J20_12270 [Flavobacteriaceae bacterium]|nr:hypothetical protein [Flavobacteriaceae bacterium]
MKKNILLIFLLLSSLFVLSQNQEGEKITIHFKNENRITIIERLEELTNYRFYFLESWLNDALLSGSYKNTDLNIILDDIFKNSILNYYISKDNQGKRIIN